MNDNPMEHRGVELFCRAIKNIIWHPSSNVDTTRALCRSDDLLDWLIAFDKWFRDQSGIDWGRDLHHLYGRELSISIKLPLTNGTELLTGLQRLAEGTVQRGYKFTIVLDVPVFAAFPDAFEALFKGPISSIAVRLDNGVDPKKDQQLERLLTLASDNNIGSSIIASPESFLNSRLLDDGNVLNGYLNVFPMPAQDDGWRMLSENVDNWHCSDRLRLNIDARGDIYICQFLMGKEAARIGSVYDRDFIPWQDESFVRDTVSLYQHGPKGSPRPDDKNSESLEIPLPCRNHRSLY